ncbi:phosphofructokinase family protein ['Chrysanthemum coronarium' phytoplasma]|uniref:Phosphofructokinase family protein n=1 Tax='Chrysanthemum coronarium' phytoplasma TaxID=1520703 RepID=A0ABQ0J2W2_9MOLU|nr:phosphofructokinase family protein ['Chrysanthemum coronarium' phytoplasma]
MEKSKPFIKMAPLLEKQKEFLKLKKPTKDLNLKVFFYLKKGISNVK